MHTEFTAIIEKDGDWYIAYCPEIPGANGQGRTEDECRTSLGEAIRLILAPSPVSPFGFIVDDPEEGDHIIQAEDGSGVLLLAPVVRAALNDSIIDYRETCMGLAFTLSKVGPVN